MFTGNFKGNSPFINHSLSGNKSRFIYQFFIATACIHFLSIGNLTGQKPLMVSIGNDINTCFGSYVELNAYVAGGTPPYTFKWLQNEDIDSPFSQKIVVTPTHSAYYKVIVSDATGQKVNDEIRVEVFQKPIISVPSFLNIRQGESTTLNVNLVSANGSVSYQWKPEKGLNNSNKQSPIARPIVSTCYAVLVKDSKGCSTTEQVNVEIVGFKDVAKD